MRAAQYVRMSTELQQYSIPYQLAAIKEYASSHGFEIVHLYADEARSGIDLKGRPGLKQLLDDVISGSADYSTVLVYDVSRWGRFQDTDEAAHWEFVCKQAGVHVEYCAEPFSNDASPLTALFKTLKRMMASEYLRELSAKVFAAQCQLAHSGYKLGGTAGYGLRRLLLNPDGTPKHILEHGQRKGLPAERITYTAGPRYEVRVVRKIYGLFLKSGLNCSQIASYLNERRIPRHGGLPWNCWVVQRILSHPKYIGCVVYNQKSTKLRSKRKRNPTEKWIVTSNCFEPLISQERYDAAQERLRTRVFLRSDDQLLVELSAFVKKHGRITRKALDRDRNMATSCTYDKRFGSLGRALDKVEKEPPEGFSETELRARIKRSLQAEFSALLLTSNMPSRAYKSMFLFEGRSPLLIEVAKCIKKKDGRLRWQIRYPVGKLPLDNLGCVALRLDSDNKTELDYLFFPAIPLRKQRVVIGDEDIRKTAIIRGTLKEIANLVVAPPYDNRHLPMFAA